MMEVTEPVAEPVEVHAEETVEAVDAMGHTGGELFPRERAEIVPGAVHVPDWLEPGRQRELLEACREWARPPAGLRRVRTPGGGR